MEYRRQLRAFLTSKLKAYRVNSDEKLQKNRTVSVVSVKQALVDTLDQRLLFSAEHPLGLSLALNDDGNDENHQADTDFIAEALDLLHKQKSEHVNADLPVNDDSGNEGPFVVIHVTTTEDTLDAPDRSSYEELMANPGLDNAISLREAIDVANADSSVDVVRLSAGTYTLDLVESEPENADSNQGGDLDLGININVDVDADVNAAAAIQYIIQGAGEDTTFIKQDVGNERVLHHQSGHVIIRDLTIEDGSAERRGGGLTVRSPADTVLQNVRFENNEAVVAGGGLHVFGAAVLDNVTFENNTAESGGAISISSDASVTITNSALENNQAIKVDNAISAGGGISVEGKLFLYDSIVRDNSVNDSNGSGGGINVLDSGEAIIAGSLIKGNESAGFGGGIANSGVLTLTDSQLIENTAKGIGAGLFNGKTATVERTLIWGRGDEESADTFGVGVFNNGNGNLTLLYSVVANNVSDAGGAGVQSNGDLTIRSSIIAGNKVVGDAGTGAGGVFVNGSDNKFARISDSIVANNSAFGSDSDLGADDDNVNEITSVGFNLFEHFSEVTPLDTDILNVDPMFSMDLMDDQVSIDINTASVILNSGSSMGVGDLTMAGTVVDSSPNIGGVTTDFEAGLVFWATATGDIYRSSPTFSFNQRIVTSLGPDDLKDLEVNTALGRLFFLDESGDSIKSTKLDGTELRDEFDVGADAVAFAIDADDQRIYVAVAGASPHIDQYDMSDDSATPIAIQISEASGDPTDIEYDDINNTLYWSTSGSDASIRSLQRDSSDPENWQSSSNQLNDTPINNEPYALAIEESSNIVYWSDEVNGTLSSYDPSRANEVSTVDFSVNGDPQAVAFNNLDGELLVGNDNEQVFSVDASLDTTLLAELPDNTTMFRSDFIDVPADEQAGMFVGPSPMPNGGANVVEGESVLLNKESLQSPDADSRPDQVFYTHNVSDPDENIDELTITVDTIATNTFTQADIDNERVRITHNGVHLSVEDSTWTINMRFDVTDHNSGLMETSDFAVRVQNVDDAPVFTLESPVLVGDATPVLVGTDNFFTTDEDTRAENIRYNLVDPTEYSFVNMGNDTTSFSASELRAGNISFRYDGAAGDRMFNIEMTVTDGTTTVDATFIVEVNAEAASAAPTTGEAATFTLKESSKVKLDNAILGIMDSDTPDEDVFISYVRDMTPGGHLEINGFSDQDFSLDDLNAGEVFFVHNGEEATTEAYVDLLIEDDSSNEVEAPRITFVVEPVNNKDPVAVNHTVSGRRDEIFNTVERLPGESGSTINTLLHGASDEDLPDDALSVSLLSEPSSGTVDIQTDGTFGYTVKESISKDESFQDSFTYQITDDAGHVSAPATVTISVEGLERPAYTGELANITLDELEELDHVFEQDAFTSPDASEPFVWSIHIDNRPIPAWLSLDEDTGTLSGTPADSDVESFELHVLVTDEHGLESDEVPIMITINDINQTSVINFVDTETVEENSEGQLVATVDASDPDANDILIYSADDSRFRFDDNELRLRDLESLDFETDDEVVLTVTVDDQQGGDKVSREITIQVTNVNESPTLEITDLDEVQENTSDVDVATVIVSDQDAGETPDTSVSDNRFEIVEDKLRLRAGEELDFDTESQVPLTVSVTDGVNDPVTEDITVMVTNANEPPTLEITDLVDVQENRSDVVVATVIVSDPDAGAELDVSVSDNRFEVAEDELRLRSGEELDFEREPQVSLTVSVQDGSGVRITREVDITVLNVNENPVQTIAVPDQQIEDGDVLTSIFNAYTDPDGDELTFTLTRANGDALPSWLVFDQVAGELRTGDLPRDEVSARLKLSADDGNGGVLQLEFTVSFLPEPEIGFVSPFEEELPDIDGIEFAPEVPTTERESESAAETSTDTELEESTEPESRTAETSDALSGIFIDSDDDSISTGVSRTNAISEFLSAQSDSRADGSDIGLMQRDVFNESTSLTDLFAITSQLDPDAFSAFQENFEKQREIFESDIAASKGIVVSSITLSSGLSVGYILYLLRGGAIMTSMLSSLPAWRFVDPLPILGHMEGSLNVDEESLETLVTESGQ